MNDAKPKKRTRTFKKGAREAKNEKIRESLAATKAKREHQVCRVFDMKIQSNHLSKKQKEALKRAFLEAKWLRNDALAHGIFEYEIEDTVTVKVGDVFEERKMIALGSQIKQSVITNLKQDCYNLAKAKKKGRHVGALKFKKQVKSIDLKQYGTTYRFANADKTRVKIQKIPGTLRVRGIKQIPKKADFANAKLVDHADGYHLMVTVFLYKDDPYVLKQNDYTAGTVVGVDMGLKTSLALSDGSLVKADVEETDRLRKLQKRRTRQKKGSNNYARTSMLIRREYKKMSDKRDNLANQIVRDLTRNEHVCFQDENLPAWRSRHGCCRGGRSIQHSILGRVKARLKKHDRVLMLARSVPTTQYCPCCHGYTKHGLNRRVYTCEYCGYSFVDRDVHAACDMIRLSGLVISIPMERRFKPVENLASADVQILAGLCASHPFVDGICKRVSVKQEAPRL